MEVVEEDEVKQEEEDQDEGEGVQELKQVRDVLYLHLRSTQFCVPWENGICDNISYYKILISSFSYYKSSETSMLVSSLDCIVNQNTIVNQNIKKY